MLEPGSQSKSVPPKAYTRQVEGATAPTTICYLQDNDNRAWGMEIGMQMTKSPNSSKITNRHILFFKEKR